MKLTISIIVLSLITISGMFAQQTSWQWINPLPQGNLLNSVYAVSKDTVYAVGDLGTILKTTNSGRTWQVTPTAAGITEALYSIEFVSPSNGYAVGEFGRILRTTDAGVTWFIQPTTNTKDLFIVKFISLTTGWAVGAQGAILKTTDGGNTWVSQTSGLVSSLYGVYFFDALTGWIVGTNGNLIKTTNGGTTWELKTTGTIQNLYSVHFINASIGTAVGSFGLIIHSTDGGNTWIPQISGTSFSLFGVQFTSSLNGWATGSYGTIIKTTNGGFSWFGQSSNTYNDFYGVHFTSSTTGWTVGDFGTIDATSDGGTTWILQSSGVMNVLNAISFLPGSLGIAVGEEGTIIRSSDGGSTWSQQASGVTQILFGVNMINKDIGWAVGDSAVILKTTNSGMTWTEQNSHTDISLYSVYFANSTTGWAVGDFGTILATINGGTTWIPETSNVAIPLMRIKFFNQYIGWAVGYGGEIIKTTNGGKSWISQISNTSQTLYGLDIVDANTVYAIGDLGTVVFTTDGGTTWLSSMIDGWLTFYGCAFNGKSQGWAVGENGTVEKTTDAGKTWFAQNSGTLNTLWDIQQVRSSNGGGTLFAAGIGGTLIGSGISPLPLRTWAGTFDSLWTNPGNWSPVGVPEKGDSVFIPVTPIQPTLRTIMQQVNIGGFRINAGAKLTIGSGIAQFVVSGTIQIDGTLEMEPTSILELIAGDNFSFGINGKLIPAQSTVICNNTGQLRGPFFNLFITSNANVQSLGNIEIKNNLTIHSLFSMRQIDTITILNPDPQGFQGDGIINGGTIKRALRTGATHDYRFESPVTYVRFYPTGIIPDTLLMTTYPNTLGPGLPDTVFVKRYYSISAIGGNNYQYLLSLRYDSSETSIPIDKLGMFRDSSGIIFNMGVSDFLDSDLVAISLDSVSHFSTWYIGKYDYYWKHPLQFFDSLAITDNGLLTDTLLFGTAPGATDGIDPYWGETPLSPKPALGTFDIRWVIPSTNGTAIDVRNILSPTHQQIIYRCNFQPGPGGYPIKLHWNKTIFPIGTPILRDALTQGGYFSVNMRTQDSFIITNPLINGIEIVYNAPSYYTFQTGWNMVSLPVIPWSDNHKTKIFPTAISSAYAYTNMYVEEDTLTHGIGYWLKFPSQDIIPLDGSPSLLDTMLVSEGWNMIGSIATPINVSSIIQQPGNIVKSEYFFYNYGYTPQDTIYPARAYWVKASQAGKLIISGTLLSANQKITKLHDELRQLNTLTITDKNGAQQMLYFGEDENHSVSIEHYELPPPPPYGTFDARFVTNRMVERTSAESPFITIKVQTDAFPVTIAWNISQNYIRTLNFTNATTGKNLSSEINTHSGAFQISDPSVNIIKVKLVEVRAIPTEFALKQNYPNPFNPSTLIKFELPIDAIVMIKVYNILGQEVATLIDNKLIEAGIHQIEFNQNNFADLGNSSSGVYFYRILAKGKNKSFVDVKKMLLLK